MIFGVVGGGGATGAGGSMGTWLRGCVELIQIGGRAMYGGCIARSEALQVLLERD